MKAKARLTIGGGRDFDNGRVSQHPSSFEHAYNAKTIHTRSVEIVEARRKKRLIDKFHERNTFSLYERNTTSTPTKIFSLSVSFLFRLLTLKRLVTEDETLTEESYILHARVYMHICMYIQNEAFDDVTFIKYRFTRKMVKYRDRMPRTVYVKTYKYIYVCVCVYVRARVYTS